MLHDISRSKSTFLGPSVHLGCMYSYKKSSLLSHSKVIGLGLGVGHGKEIENSYGIRDTFSRNSLTFRHEHEDGGGLGVGSAAGVVAGVSVVRLSNGESALSFCTGFGLHGDSSSSCVVVDHTVVVVPEHVLWRLRALQNRWYRASEEIEQFGGVSLFPVVRLPIALKDERSGVASAVFCLQL